MQKNFVLDTTFWVDDYVIDLDPVEKSLFLYLLTNSHNNIAGVYKTNIRKIALETGIDKDMLPKIFQRFEDKGKMFYVDGWIIIANQIKYRGNRGPKTDQGIKNVFDELPDDVQLRCLQVWKERGIARLLPWLSAEDVVDEVPEVQQETVTEEKRNSNKELDRMLFQLNEKLGGNSKIKPTNDRRNKLKARLKQFEFEELMIAAQHLATDDFMQGQNDNNKRYGTIDYLLRNDTNVVKYFEMEAPKKKVSYF